ncbi:putative glycosyl transferase [Ruminiclostridium hungatei]|uniref:Putative glycosyl transferase n=1 Tax=Ruminiclostridium hungatei TaxID=48256 RepID=A0A1V4SI89_RUMHU|nr:glycosyltransferase [Ruminiclostridium hungatei]OPX42957.1 putative glycosyl transferase [Ruminiclostridium hungatei]
MANIQLTTCIAIPVYNRLDLINRCLDRLEKQLDQDNILLLLVDDGSSQEFQASVLKRQLFQRNNAFYVKHEKNMGVTAARNTSISWCRTNNVDILIMLDSDCEVAEDFIRKHIELHKAFPDIACFGAGINGVGKGFWAVADRIMSWAPSVPAGAVRELNRSYSPPSANISFKMSKLPLRDKVFNECLETGEDVALISELRRAGEKIYFSPQPAVRHYDRDSAKGVFKHAYSWGKHIYFLQMGGNISARCFNIWYRILFFLSFFIALPAFGCLGMIFTIKPWLRTKPLYVFYSPVIFLLWVIKGIAVLQMALNPFSYIPAGHKSVCCEAAGRQEKIN